MNSRGYCIKCKSQLWKDYRFFKLIFIVFCSWLIVEEFYTFFIVKPAHTAQAIRKFLPEDFPEILLCPEPSIDLNVARSKGYEGIQEYFLGTGTDDFETPPLMGWGVAKADRWLPEEKKFYHQFSIVKYSYLPTDTFRKYVERHVTW